MTCSLVCIAAAAATWLAPMTDHLLDGVQAPFHYFSTKPVSQGDECSVAVVIVHGWGEDPQAPAREALTFREAACLMLGEGAKQPFVVAPAFPRPSMMKKWKCPSDGRAIWNTSWEGRGLNERGEPSDDWRGGGDAAGVEMSSYDVIDRMFAVFGDVKLYPNLKRVVLLGNSAGGQFAGRYAAVGKGFVRDGVEVAYMVVAPSTQFRLDDDVIWHYGLKGRPRYSRGLSREQIYANLSSRRVWYGCGVDDVKGKPFTSLDSTPEAMLQGANRFERFLNLEKYLKKFPEWAKMASFTPIPGIAHNGEKAYTYPPLVRFALGIDK